MLERRIDSLPELYRSAFMMRAVEEISVEETAAALGLPEAKVRQRYFRARAPPGRGRARGRPGAPRCLLLRLRMLRPHRSQRPPRDGEVKWAAARQFANQRRRALNTEALGIHRAGRPSLAHNAAAGCSIWDRRVRSNIGPRRKSSINLRGVSPMRGVSLLRVFIRTK